jgi:hypothetical protein
MMRAALGLAVLLCAAPAFAGGQVTKPGGPYPACRTEKLLDEFAHGVQQRDTNLMLALMTEGECVLLPELLAVSRLESSTWTGHALIRAYVSGKSLVLWTFASAIAEAK